MAFEAQLAINGIQKALMLRGVGRMARHAAVFTFDRLMLDRHVRARVLMAGEAESVARLDE
jgi:hypothetical protein